jgi:hypothetical protein
MSGKKEKYSKPWPVGNVIHLQKKIWLNPKYQREEVWTLSQKQLLIDSILRDLDLPKFYFRQIKKKNYEYEVVDGQQRLRTIFEFEKNKFKLSSDSDNVGKFVIGGSAYKDLHTDLKQEFLSKPIDIVHLNEYSDDDVEEMFLRLQNGTPLNAPEKRRAITGKMRYVVEDLSRHKVFGLMVFSNKRFAYEDAVAKILHLILAGKITDIKPLSICKTYENNKGISIKTIQVKRLVQTFNFLDRAFKSIKKSPNFKKFSIISISFLAYEMLEKYDLSLYPTEFAKSYLDFELRRRENEEKSEDQQNSELAAYTDAARSDSIPDMEFRDKTLWREIMIKIPELKLKDSTRGFSSEQRSVVFWRDKGICSGCNKRCDESEYEIDHSMPHSRGGETKLSNARLLCVSCNRKKGSKI